jgi:3-hydroxybutyryl-CoA dehydrogenase
MEIRKVGVLGCGLMGSGIAQVPATAGFEVTVLEVEQSYLDRGLAGIRKSLEKLAAKGQIQEGPEQVLRRLQGTTKKEALAQCDLVVEAIVAIVENLDRKREIFSALDKIVPQNAIFASNTSSISITEMMTATRRPERFVGLHFFKACIFSIRCRL